MIALIIFIVFGFVVLHLLIVVIKISEDTLADNEVYYEYCEDCKYGWCMEEPQSVDCQKWKDEHEKTPS